MMMLSISGMIEAAPSPEITAQAAIVMDAITGKVLYAKNAEERRYPASTTKIMTLIIALERGKLDDSVTAHADAVDTEGSTLWLSEGEKLSLQDMLYGMMLVSGNDATIAVADYIAGGPENFAKLMTEKAHAIGAMNTNFVNPNGLPDPNHYSTAHDLALITAYGYKIPEFRNIVSTKEKTMSWQGKATDRELSNENRMLWLYEGANGVKTGYTEAAGRCLVSGASRNGLQLIAVVLDSEFMWDDSIKLLDYGFESVKPQTLFYSGDILKTVRVFNGKSDRVKLLAADTLTVPEGEEGEYRIEFDVNSLEAPILAGQKVGAARVYRYDNEIAAVDLIATDVIEKKSFFGLIWGFVNKIFSFFLS
jgi:D-alanyl-D-alanine carboxypeptidase (penicillin-binding protein 5/6)